MGAFGGRLHARLDAQRDGREAAPTCTGTRRARTSPGREEKVELNLPEGPEADARLRQVAERDAGRARNRLRDHRAPADLLPRRPSRRRAPLPRLSRDGRGILRAHQGLADHAHHRDEEASIVDEHPWAARNLYNAFLESKRRSIERISIPPCRAIRAVADDLCAQDARHVRRRPVPLRHRGEPADLGADGALHLPAGHRAPSCEAGGDLSRRAS